MQTLLLYRCKALGANLKVHTAYLKGVNLIGVNLKIANLQVAILKDSNCKSAICKPLSNTFERNKYFEGANL